MVEITDETPEDAKCDPDAGTVLSVSCGKSEWDSIWHPYFDLDTDYRKIRGSIPEDDWYLAKAARLGAGIRILRQDRFEMLISFIISQRKSIPAIRTSIEKLVGLFGSDGFFPEPQAMMDATEEEFASCSLGYRTAYVRDAVRRVACRDVDLDRLDDLPDEELFGELKSFCGVGDKVANCVMLFAYHRIGRAPVDTWIARIINEEYGGADPFPRYEGVAGIMQQYMFYRAQHAERKPANS